MVNNKSQLTKLFTLLGITLILSVVLIFSLTITDISNYADGLTTSNSSVVFEYNLTFDGVGETMNNLTWNWNGTNYTIYDDSLALFMNFDNRSSLGENDTHVKDLSLYGNNGTVTGATFNATGGKYNGAYQFDGVNDNINLGTPTSLNFDNHSDYTFSFWINQVLKTRIVVCYKKIVP